LRARHYDPDTGRFLQEDLVSSINQYAFADNSPILLTDPLGLQAGSAANAIGGFASGILFGYEGIGRGYYDACSPAYRYGQMAGMAWWFALGPAGAIDTALARTAGAAAGSGAVVPMAESLYQIGTVRNVAGYQVWGNVGLVGNTYNVNVLGLYAQQGSQGLRALATALRVEAQAAGATQISISGNAIVNPGLARMTPGMAARLGFQIERVNAESIILRGVIP